MPNDNANLTVPWKAVAIGSFTIALTTLTITAVVVSAKNADVLSVVALGLAVIAFVIQIIVFIVQAAAASQQQVRSEQIYGLTVKALTTIEEKTEGTQRVVGTINERLLGALLGKAAPAVASEGLSPLSPEYASSLAENVARLANVVQDRRDERPNSSRDERSGSSGLLEVTQSDRAKMREAPTPAEVQAVLEVLKELDEDDVLDLVRLGMDQETYQNDPDVSPGIETISNPEHLTRLGLIRKTDAHWSNNPVFILTPRGMIAARTLRSKDIPTETPQEVADLRKQARQHEEEWKQFIPPPRNVLADDDDDDEDVVAE